MSRLLKEKIAKIVIYNARVTGRTNYDYPGQPWVPKLVNDKKIENPSVKHLYQALGLGKFRLISSRSSTIVRSKTNFLVAVRSFSLP